MSKNNQDGCIRAYHRSSKAWYASAPFGGHLIESEEVMFGMYHPQGGTSGEMSMRWKDLGGRCCQMAVYGDAFATLAQFTDLLQALADKDQHMTEPEFCAILDKCGFEDITAYEQD